MCFLWWFPADPVPSDPDIFALVTVHLNKQSPLPGFTGLILQGKTITSQISLGDWRAQLVALAGRKAGLAIGVPGWTTPLSSF